MLDIELTFGVETTSYTLHQKFVFSTCKIIVRVKLPDNELKNPTDS